MGRVGCTLAALLKMALVFETVEEGISVVMVLLLQLLRYVLTIVQMRDSALM